MKKFVSLIKSLIVWLSRLWGRQTSNLWVASSMP